MIESDASVDNGAMSKSEVCAQPEIADTAGQLTHHDQQSPSMMYTLERSQILWTCAE